MNRQRIIEAIMSRRFLLMLAIVAAALALRVWGIGFDLPDLSHPDEHHEVHRALRLANGSFEWDRVGKGGFFYLLFVEYGALFVVLKLAGVVGSPNDLMELFIRDPSIFWLLGRGSAALLGALNVWLTFFIGRRIGDYRLGVVAAAFLAFCSLSALHAHLLTVDIPMTTGVLATVLFSFRLHETGARRDYLWAGFFAAVAVTTKLSAAPIVSVVALAHLLRGQEQPTSWQRRLLDRRLLASALMCVVVYCIATPSVIVKSYDAILNMSTAVVGEPGREPSPERQNQVSYYAEATAGSLGLPTAILCALGSGLCAVRRRPSDLLLLSFPVLLYVAILLTGSHWRHARFILPAIPLMLMMAAQVLLLTVDTMRLSIRQRRTAVVIVVAILCAPRLVEIGEQNITFSQPATTIQARNWIENHIPKNTRIQLLGYPGNREQRRTCPLNDTKENMLSFADQIEDESKMAAKFIRMKAESQEGATYDLLIVEPSDPWLSLEASRREGVRYVVVPVDDFVDGARAEDTGRTEFYWRIQDAPGVRLVASFKPDRISPYDSMWRDAVMEIYEISTTSPSEAHTADAKSAKRPTGSGGGGENASPSSGKVRGG